MVCQQINGDKVEFRNIEKRHSEGATGTGSLYVFLRISRDRFLRDELSFLIKTHYRRNYYLAHHTSPFKHIINFSSRMVCQIINEYNLEFRCSESSTLRVPNTPSEAKNST